MLSTHLCFPSQPGLEVLDPATPDCSPSDVLMQGMPLIGASSCTYQATNPCSLGRDEIFFGDYMLTVVSADVERVCFFYGIQSVCYCTRIQTSYPTLPVFFPETISLVSADVQRVPFFCGTQICSKSVFSPSMVSILFCFFVQSVCTRTQTSYPSIHRSLFFFNTFQRVSMTRRLWMFWPSVRPRCTGTTLATA